MMLVALWRIAFAPRPSPWNFPAYLIWALFGNTIKTDHIEAYAGWRPRVVAGRQVGVFGLALRKR